ncbi:hypothetical protein D3C84_554840 [compost metagenome]
MQSLIDHATTVKKAEYTQLFLVTEFSHQTGNAFAYPSFNIVGSYQNTTEADCNLNSFDILEHRLQQIGSNFNERRGDAIPFTFRNAECRAGEVSINFLELQMLRVRVPFNQAVFTTYLQACTNQLITLQPDTWNIPRHTYFGIYDCSHFHSP